MKAHHWIGAIVILIVGYYLGVKFPGAASSITGAVSGS
jgi:hypothetical protein